MTNRYSGIQYNFILPHDGSPFAPDMDPSRFTDFDLCVRSVANFAFGPDVQVEFAALGSEENETGTAEGDGQSDQLGQPSVEITGQPTETETQASEAEQEPAVGLFAPDVQAKLNMSPRALLPAHALGIPAGRERSGYTRIMNTLEHEGVTTVRKVYLLGHALSDLRGIDTKGLASLKEWLIKRSPRQMPPLMIDRNARPTPEFAATFCTDLSQIQIEDIPAVFRSPETAFIDSMSLAEYKSSYMNMQPPKRFRRAHVSIGAYIRGFDAAKAKRAAAVAQGSSDGSTSAGTI